MRMSLGRSVLALWLLTALPAQADPPITPVVVDQDYMLRMLRAALAEVETLERTVQRPPELQKKVSARTQAASAAIQAALTQVEHAPKLERPLADGRPLPDRPVGTGNHAPVVVVAPGPGPLPPVVVVTPPVQTAPPAPVAVTPVMVAQAMSAADLNRVADDIRRESFSDSKLRIVSSVAGVSYFTVSQVQLLLGCFTFDKDKLQTIQLLAPRILDRENVYKIYGSFDFESSKKEAEKYLR